MVGKHERGACASLCNQRNENGDARDEEDENREPRDASRRATGAAEHAAPARDHKRQRRSDDPLRAAEERHELFARQASFPLNARPSR